MTEMDACAVADALARAEEDGGLLEFEFDGWAVWPLFRFDVGMRLQRLKPDGAQGIGRRPPWSRVLRDLLSLATVRRSANLFVVYSSNLLELEGGKYKDIFFDDLVAIVGGVKLEHRDSPAFAHASKQAKFPSDLTTSACLMGYGLASRVARPIAAIDKLAAPFAAAVRAAFGAEIVSVNDVQARLAHFYWLKRCYRVILRLTGVQRMLLVTAYCDHAAVAAARELGVLVIELQHGLVDRNHYGYSWTASALRHSKRMPIPDRVWLYGEYWREELGARGFWRDRLRVMGSPRIDRVRTTRKRSLPDRRTWTVVVTTQGIYTERLIEFVKQMFRHTGGMGKLKIMIRLHPAEGSGERYLREFAGSSDVSISSASEEPSTYELIADAHWHASISSTCHYEAIALGTPTIVLGFPTSESVRHLVDQGAARIANSPEELMAIVNTCRPEPMARGVGERYFAPGALKNMIDDL